MSQRSCNLPQVCSWDTFQPPSGAGPSASPQGDEVTVEQSSLSKHRTASHHTPNHLLSVNRTQCFLLLWQEECSLPSPGACMGTSICYLNREMLSLKPRPGGPHKWAVGWEMYPSITLPGLWVMFTLKSEQRHGITEPCKMISLPDFFVSHLKSLNSLTCHWLSRDPL